MHQPPVKRGKQSWESACQDLSDASKRYADAAEWIRNLAGVLKNLKGVVYTNQTAIFNGQRSIDIVFEVPVSGKTLDMGVFSIIRRWKREELQAALFDPMTSAPAVRQIQAQIWEEDHGMKTFESWVVDVDDLWRGDKVGTIAFLNEQVQGWLKYWFGLEIPVQHRRDIRQVREPGSAK